MVPGPRLQRVLHIALAGARVELASSLPSQELPLREPGTTSFAYYDVGSPLGGVSRQEFSSGSAEFQNQLATDDGVVLSESYSVASGTLRAGSAVQTDPDTGASGVFRLGVWEEGPASSSAVSSFLYHGSQSDLVALFSKFSFEDTASGIRMVPLPGSDALLVQDESHSTSIAKPISMLGLLDVQQLTPHLAPQIPTDGGTTLDSGQRLYVEHPGTPDMTLLLVTATAFTRIYPHEGISEADAVRRASSLDISWVPLPVGTDR